MHTFTTLSQELVGIRRCSQLQHDYVDSWVVRSWKAITQPVHHRVKNQIEIVKSTTRHVIGKSNSMISQRVEMDAGDMSCKSASSQPEASTGVWHFPTDAYNNSLATLRQTLHVTNTCASLAKIIDACATVKPAGIFASASRRDRTIHLQEADTDLLYTTGLLARFQSPTQSSLLLLSGTNHLTLHYVGYRQLL